VVWTISTKYKSASTNISKGGGQVCCFVAEGEGVLWGEGVFVMVHFTFIFS